MLFRSGGVVLRVKSIRIEPSCIVFIGSIPSDALVFENPSEFSGELQPRSIGFLHLTWSSLLYPDKSEDIGYLVLQTPVTITGLLPESEDGEAYWVAVAVERSFCCTLPLGSIGAACCAACNRPIPKPRLLAVPNTKICIRCQERKEQKWSKQAVTSSR